MSRTGKMMDKMIRDLMEENERLKEANKYCEEHLEKIKRELEYQTSADQVIADALEKLDFDKLEWNFSPVHDGDCIRKAVIDGWDYPVGGWRNMFLYNCYTSGQEIIKLKDQVQHYKDMYESLKGILNQKGF